MDNASGRFCYIEDPDGTLIELVETQEYLSWKKWLVFRFKKAKSGKPLPKWMIKCYLSKVK
jgi:hypothetical protein